MIILDGKEAGGQTLRSALSLSAITQQPFTIKNIRGARPNPGLEAQHLAAVRAMQEICNATVKGSTLHSPTLEFIPNEIQPGTYELDIGTAGSTTLLLQTVIPALIKADKPTRMIALGGTDTLHALPSMDFQEVFLEYLTMIGIDTTCEIASYGFYPKGQGRIILEVIPAPILRKLELKKRGKFQEASISSYCSDALQKKRVAERMAQACKENLKEKGEILTDMKYKATASPGGFVNAHVHFENAIISQTCLAELKKTAEEVGRECAKLLNQELATDSTADHFTADQLMIYFALAGSGFVRVSQVTEHMKTNARVIEEFLPVKFSFDEN
ncbi:MAG: RNA 3'-terminal phosphate cyclase, partial [Nanoarchaeota archaeon]